jgi:DNA modification methylase
MTSLAVETPRAASVRRFDEVDWDFPDQLSESPFSDLHWHPCRFPSQIPAVVIGRFTAPGDAILDPFVGSGTTVVEAQRLGRPSVGVDVNPIACLVTRAKTLNLEAREISQFLRSARTRLLTQWDRIESSLAPASVQKDKWYTRATQRSLERLWGFVLSHNGQYKVLLRTAFSAILLPACREIRHWGYVCDNSTPKANRERDVRELFCNMLERFEHAYVNRDSRKMGTIGDCSIHQGDAATVLDSLPDRSFSCFITSPPYFGVTDYVKAQRLSMEWLELDIEPARLLEIGARSKRHRSSAAEDYIEEMGSAFKQVYRVLKRGGWGVVLYGQSPTRKSAKHQIVSKLLSLGFRLELMKPRQIPDTRRQYPSLRDEFVLLLRKP